MYDMYFNEKGEANEMLEKRAIELGFTTKCFAKKVQAYKDQVYQEELLKIVCQ